MEDLSKTSMVLVFSNSKPGFQAQKFINNEYYVGVMLSEYYAEALLQIISRISILQCKVSRQTVQSKSASLINPLLMGFLLLVRLIT